MYTFARPDRSIIVYAHLHTLNILASNNYHIFAGARPTFVSRNFSGCAHNLRSALLSVIYLIVWHALQVFLSCLGAFQYIYMYSFFLYVYVYTIFAPYYFTLLFLRAGAF